MGWIDEQGQPVTNPEIIQQLEFADQGQVSKSRGVAALESGLKIPFSQLAQAEESVRKGYETINPTIVSPFGFDLGPVDIGMLGFGAAKAGKGLVGLLRRPWTQAGRVAQAAKAVGREVNPAIRLAQGEQPIRDAYHLAEEVQAQVPTDSIRAAVDNARRLVKDPQAIEELDSIINRHIVPRGQLIAGKPAVTTPYSSVVKASQELPTKGYDNVTNAALRSVREAMVNATKEINPALSQANAVTAHFHASNKVINIIEKSTNTANAIAKIDSLFALKPNTVKALGINSPQAMQAFRSVVASGATPEVIKHWLALIARHAIWGAGAAAGYGAIRHAVGNESQGGGGGY